jgi:hypothetical protein
VGSLTVGASGCVHGFLAACAADSSATQLLAWAPWRKELQKPGENLGKRLEKPRKNHGKHAENCARLIKHCDLLHQQS